MHLPSEAEKQTERVEGGQPWQGSHSDTSSHGHHCNCPGFLSGTAQRGFFNELKIAGSEGLGREVICREI